MKKAAVAIIIAVLIIGGLAGWYYLGKKNGSSEWITQKVSRGNIKTTISASGSLAALTTVEVGSQVSGNILKLFADFNDVVKAGQLVAQLEPSTYEAQVQQAKANLENAIATEKNNVAQVKNLEASLLNAKAEISISRANINKAKVTQDESERNYKRVEELFKRKLVSTADRDTAKAGFDSAKASYEVSLAQLESSKAREMATKAQIDAAKAQIEGAQARVRQMEAQMHVSEINLDRTKISSPIDGVVISREVDEGQTVAASLQAPKLFVIAQDLRKMQIDTAVDEADIGLVHDGQAVTFTVDAYKDKVFKGKIHQVRLMPIETSNVVTYSVMVNVENDELLLKPGMTANVEIIVGNRKDVLRIPSKALYFKAPENLKAQKAETRNATDTLPIWILQNGKPLMKSVKIGISNDRFIEVVSGDLEAGQEIIVGQGAAGANKGGSGGKSVSARDVRRATRRM